MKAAQAVIPVADLSHVGEVRRRVNQLAADARLPEAECGKAAIVATELATNLVRYAVGGEMIISCVTATGPRYDQSPDTDAADASTPQGWIEMISVDRGPGMPDLGRCLEDGFSTGGGAGEGLGAVRRLSTEWDCLLPADDGNRDEQRRRHGRLFAGCPAANTAVVRCLFLGRRQSAGPAGTTLRRRVAAGRTKRRIERDVGRRSGSRAGSGSGRRRGGRRFRLRSVCPASAVAAKLQRVRMQGTRGGAMAAARIDGD